MTRRYDLALILVTAGLLLALGALCVYGTAHSFLASRADPEWTATAAYERYLGRMNGLAYPLVAGLVLTMGLCIPKRLIPPRLQTPAGATLLALAAAASAAGGPRAGLAAVMLVSLVLQAAVTALALARSPRLFFERAAHGARLGSALLHLGFVLVAVDLAVLNDSPWHMALFWAAAVLMMAGTALAFYSPELPHPGRRPEGENP